MCIFKFFLSDNYGNVLLEIHPEVYSFFHVFFLYLETSYSDSPSARLIVLILKYFGDVHSEVDLLRLLLFFFHPGVLTPFQVIF